MKIHPLDKLDPVKVTEFNDTMHGPVMIYSKARTLHLGGADMDMLYRMPAGKKGRWFITVAFQEAR